MVWLLFFAVFTAGISFEWNHLFARNRMNRLWEQSLTGAFGRSKKQTSTYWTQVEAMTTFLGEPTLLPLIQRWAVAGPVAVAFVFLILHVWIGVIIAPAAFTLPLFWLEARYKRGWRILQQQLRDFRLTLAYLVKAGATMEIAVHTATQSVAFPLRPFLDDACREMGFGDNRNLRLETVLSALRRLGERVNSDDMTQLVQLLEMGNKHDSAVAERVLQALDIEDHQRDTLAEKRYTQLETQIDMISIFLLEMPTEIYLLLVGLSLMGTVGQMMGLP